MDPVFWATLAAGALAGIGAGLILQASQHWLDERRRRADYRRIRGALVNDLLNNLRVVDALWMNAKQPYHTMEPGLTLNTILQGETARVTGGKPFVLAFETWEMARPHILATAPNPREGLRFARAFEFFRACLAPLDESVPALAMLKKWGHFEPNSVIQPDVVTRVGHQLHAVPGAVLRATQDPNRKQTVVDLVVEYGTDEQVEKAQQIGGHDWMHPGSWEGVGGTAAWVPHEFVPSHEGPRPIAARATIGATPTRPTG